MIYDKDGKVTRKLSTSDSNRVYVSLDKIPGKSSNAFISIEDVRFYNHNGIDTGTLPDPSSWVSKESLWTRAWEQCHHPAACKITSWEYSLKKLAIERTEAKIKEQSLALELENHFKKKDSGRIFKCDQSGKAH